MGTLPHRKIMRLQNYDYSQNGYYFITICAHNRRNIFGRLVGAGLARPEIQLYEIGQIAERCLRELPTHFPNIKVHKHVVMQNHVHFILELGVDYGRADPAPTRTIGQMIAFYKYQTTKTVDIKQKLWQRGYHDHIIRNEQDYLDIWEYIDTNPLKWEQDRYYNKRNVA